MVTGPPLAELKKRAVERVANGVLWDDREYVMYPPAMKSPYRERRSAFGHERYIDRDLGLAQWADLGMYLQTVMLLLRYRTRSAEMKTFVGAVSMSLPVAPRPC